jgi:hypothetical protein
MSNNNIYIYIYIYITLFHNRSLRDMSHFLKENSKKNVLLIPKYRQQG